MGLGRAADRRCSWTPTWEGQPRKLLLHANRNGFFYVLDRTNGALLLPSRSCKKLTWASGIGADGRPMLNPDQEPTSTGTRVCPAVEGATNWFSTAFNPATGLYYVQTLERCNIYATAPDTGRRGGRITAVDERTSPGETAQKVLRAHRRPDRSDSVGSAADGPGGSWGGALSTAGGLVFYGDDGGAFMAVDAKTGERLWRFQANAGGRRRR